MDTVAIWSATEREELFRDTAELLPALQSPSLIKKDFWVCWLLRRLFLLDHDIPMIFKGGTSLSKAYRLIRRFSEDIDLSLDRTGLDLCDGAVRLVGQGLELVQELLAPVESHGVRII